MCGSFIVTWLVTNLVFDSVKTPKKGVVFNLQASSSEMRGTFDSLQACGFQCVPDVAKTSCDGGR